jgi:phosphoenolpyruvate carboxykinase (ATP)
MGRRKTGIEKMALFPPIVNASAATLIEHTLAQHAGSLSADGALVVTTGKYTGRSPLDKYIVRDAVTAPTVWWGDVNQPMEPAHYTRLRDRVEAHLAARQCYVLQASVNADPRYAYNITLHSESPWHTLFAGNLFRSSWHAQQPLIRILHAPTFDALPDRDGTRSNVAIVLDIASMTIVICGTAYAGEIKKAVFTLLNFLLPMRDVMPMHAGVNVGRDGDVAVFFGLSGTGKTTLSTDPDRPMVGDDEHGWSDRGVFNFEGGCYAKTIHLSAVGEPEIYAATKQFGTVLENVVIDTDSHVPDYDDTSISENGRAAYGLDTLENIAAGSMAGHPKTILMLTADAFGVLPPLSRLTVPQAMYHFLSGYTAKVAGTERGVKEPVATFSTCFGAPFMVLHPGRYAALLAERLQQHGSTVWLVNTGWSGGPYGVGSRVSLANTRAMVRAALTGALADVAYTTDPVFGLAIPQSCPDVDPSTLDPRTAWGNADAWQSAAQRLARLFHANYALVAAEAPAGAADGAPLLRD